MKYRLPFEPYGIFTVLMFVLLFPSGCGTKSDSPSRWLKGNLHTHTSLTGADASPEEVIQWYRDHDYDFLVMTDHDTLPEDWGMKKAGGRKILVIPGAEITAGQIHIGAIQITQPIRGDRARIPDQEKETMRQNFLARGKTPEETEDLLTYTEHLRMIKAVHQEIKNQGGLAVFNHPCISPPGHVLLGQARLNFFELVNPHQEARYGKGGKNECRIHDRWDELLTLGHRLYAVGGDDANHFHPERKDALRQDPYHPEYTDGGYYPPGKVWVRVQAERLAVPSILNALREGRFYLTTGVEFRTLDLSNPSRLVIEVVPERDTDYLIYFIGSGGGILKQVSGIRAFYEPSGREGYIRIMVRSNRDRAAFTQPVFLEHPSSVTA